MGPGIRAAVDAHFPIDEREELSQKLFLQHFDALAEPFSETADPVHVTASAIIVDDQERPALIGAGSTVLVLHKRLDRWVQPGGHIEEGELVWEAALRESREETGLDVRHPAGGPLLVHLDVHEAPKGHTHLDLRYLLIAPADDPQPAEGESQHVRWVPWADAVSQVDSGLGAALRAMANDSLPI